MIAVIDYGVGNLFSLKQSLNKIGAECVITSKTEVIAGCDRIILPGVGAFGNAILNLKKSGLNFVIKQQCESGKPLLGICLGMQLLFEKSYEYGVHDGLGLIKGSIEPLSDYIRPLKVPHMGWNKLTLIGDNPIFKYIGQGDFVYFVHSYFAKCQEGLSATTDYGMPVTAAVRKKNIYGVQFHPEKSGETGLNILRAFNEL